MKIHTRSTRSAAAAVAAVLALGTVAACGSDDDTASADASGEEPIKVMVYGPFDAKGFSVPGIETGARAGVEKVNEEGGIDGRKLELIACNDNNDPNTAAGCVRTAVKEGVVAVTGGMTTMEAQVLAGFEDAGIPVIGNQPLSNFTSPVTYPFTGGGAGILFGIGRLLAQKPECNGSVGIVQEQFATTDAVMPLLEMAITASGAEVGKIGRAPQGATDFAPAVAAAAQDCVAVVIAPTSSAPVVTALAQNPDITIAGGLDTGVPGAVVAMLGDAAEGFQVTNEYLPLNDSTDLPAMKEFLQRARAIQDDFDPESSAASAYLAPQVLKAAIEGANLEEITPATIIEALDRLSGFDTEIGPVLDFTVTNPNPAFARLSPTATLYAWVARGGQYVLDDSVEPIRLDDIFESSAG